MYKLSFVFPGQGSQYVGMGKGIFEEYKIVQETFEEASDVSSIDVKKYCFEGSLAQLSRTKNAHICILTCGIAAFRVFTQEIGYAPQFMAGHSLGEYLALTAAGVWSFEDAIKIVGLRADLTKLAVKETNGGMTIIENILTEKVEDIVKTMRDKGKKIYISSYSTMDQTAISGNVDDIMLCEDELFKAGGQLTPLVGSAPYHSPLMQPYAEELKKEIEKIELHDFRYPVISNVTGKPYKDISDVSEGLAKHLTHPVLWRQTVDYLDNKGVDLVVEMGPKNLVTNIIRNHSEDIKAVCLGNKYERNELFELYKNNEMYSKHIPTIITKCMVAAVSTPNQNWDNDEYEKGVVVPYKKIQEIQQQYEDSKIELTYEVKQEILNLLKRIFETKFLPQKEQDEWISQILEETGNNYSFKDFVAQ
ncbi:ACP S-malonyltransferase [Sedimentibacter sp. zth1]|uniref:ACP S-malonyltransferase n=1 Tax=Sedimentibacter sp. zth1 TaxID=2816908 RepID=UPI001A9238EE|nr:ACP S-malonyltransferase [Sedimentibacter sp. zth1]QSX05663.1 ACP S-malonyltransferase [Sedimentibacter sp. zth1]